MNIAEFFGSLYALAIVFFAGNMLLSIRPLSISDEPAGIRFPLYFTLGSMVLSLYMFVLYLVGLRFSVFSISLPFLAHGIYYAAKNKDALMRVPSAAARRAADLARNAAKKDNLAMTLLILLCSIVIATVFVKNAVVPIYIGDSYADWFIKAKAFFISRSIPNDLLTDPYYFYTRQDYPLAAPLCLSWISICIGHWSDTVTRVFLSTQFLSLLVFLYHSLKKAAGNVEALAGTLIVMSLPAMVNAATNGYVDINMAAITTMSGLLMLRWFGDAGRSALIVLSGLLIGYAGWTKNDGIGLFLALATTLGIFSIRRALNDGSQAKALMRQFTAFVCAALTVILPFRILALSKGIGSHMFSGAGQALSILPNLSKFGTIAGSFAYELLGNTSVWTYFWIFLILLCALNWRRITGTALGYIAMFILLYLSFLSAVYMTSSLGETAASLADNLEELPRLMLQVAPLAGYMAFAAAFGKKENENADG